MPTTHTSQRPEFIERLRAESRGLPYRPAKRKKNEREFPTPEDSHRLFNVERGNRWMELFRREPEAKMLFGEIWHQGELCMLFADTNIGKSVLAVQIGESIARRKSIAPFPCQAPPANVLYLDFELTLSQFGMRYSSGKDDYEFSDNFYRARYNFIPDPPPNVDENDLLIAAIEFKINRVKANVLIIDNITCLRGGTENSVVALKLMNSLKALKTEHNLSILVLAHTPKRRNATQPISADDLHGSKLLINFADSAFAIGKSTANTDLCYLKQIKQRNTRQRYGEDNVCLCRMQKPGTFLHFKFEGYSHERHHLLSRATAGRQEFALKVAALTTAGLSQRDISKQLNIGLATVNRLLRQGVGCADVPMRECADEEGCADVPMRECADEEGRAEEDALTTYTLLRKTEYHELLRTTPRANCPDAVRRTVWTPYRLFPLAEMFAEQAEAAHANSATRGSNDEPGNMLVREFLDVMERGATPKPGHEEAESIGSKPLPDKKEIQMALVEAALTDEEPVAGRSVSIMEIPISPVTVGHSEGATVHENFIRQEGRDSFNGADHPTDAQLDNGGP